MLRFLAVVLDDIDTVGASPSSGITAETSLSQVLSTRASEDARNTAIGLVSCSGSGGYSRAEVVAVLLAWHRDAYGVALELSIADSIAFLRK